MNNLGDVKFENNLSTFKTALEYELFKSLREIYLFINSKSTLSFCYYCERKKLYTKQSLLLPKVTCMLPATAPFPPQKKLYRYKTCLS
jgi:hypothetical protein